MSGRFLSFCACAFFFAPFFSYAGDIVRCAGPDGKTTYEVLDSFENRFLQGKPLILSRMPGGPNGLARKAISELKHLSPLRTQHYLENLATFDSESELTDAALTSGEDSKYVGIPDRCQVLQAVVQRDFSTPEQKRYVIQKSLWEKLDREQKAVLILHEIIYREAISVGQTNSIATRAFVGLLISGEIEKIPLPEFAQTLFNLDFDTFEAQGLTLRLFEIPNGTKVASLPTFGNKGALLSADLIDVGELRLANLNPVAVARGKLKPNPAHVEFWEDRLGAPKHVQSREDLDLVCIPFPVKSREIWLDHGGRLSALQAEAPFRISSETYFLNLNPGQLLFEHGRLIASHAPVIDGWTEVNGKPIPIKTASAKQDIPYLEFLPSGRIASAFARPSEKKAGKIEILPCSAQSGARARPGETLEITYSFRGGPTLRRWMIFIHFLDAQEDISFQDDEWPDRPSDSWSGDYSFSHKIQIPPDLKPGKYRIVAGLYDPNKRAERLRLDAGPRVTLLSSKRYQIGEIEVEPPAVRPAPR